METESINIIVGAVTAVVGVTVGSAVTYFVENRRQKGELERQKLAWKREYRLKAIKPIQENLDNLSKKILEYTGDRFQIDEMTNLLKNKGLGQTDAVAAVNAVRDIQFSNFIADFVKEILPAYSKVGDQQLTNIIVDDVMTPIGEDNWNDHRKEILLAIVRAHKRLEELATEF